MQKESGLTELKNELQNFEDEELEKINLQEKEMLEDIRFEMAKWSLIFVSLLALIWFAGCSTNSVDPQLSDKEALMKIADNDESLSSFDLTYNENEAMGFLGKVNTQIYPVRFGQKMVPVSRELNINIPSSVSIGDTVEGSLIRNFEGKLIIAASYDSVYFYGGKIVDTVITKPFATTITRNLKFVKIGDSEIPEENWKLIAISLPQGGTNSSSVMIDKMTIITENDTLVIEDANDYFLYKSEKKIMHQMRQWRAQLPQIKKGGSLSVMVEVLSPYNESEFVTLTYGADQKGFNKTKRLFELKSSQQEGNLYRKVYEKSWDTVNQFAGHHHAIVNVTPKQVLFDDSAPVESNTWGIPYIVKF